LTLLLNEFQYSHPISHRIHRSCISLSTYILQILLYLSGLFFSLSEFHSANEDDDILNEASFLARNLVEHIGAAIVTMGRLGILV